MEKIKRLRISLKKFEIDGYFVPKNDEYFEEFTPNYKDRLYYISNFTGSYGFSLIFKNKNYLFVDGRYTLQAKKQSGKIFKIITIPEKRPKDIFKNKKLIIGFDPKLVTKKILNSFFDKTNCKLLPIQQNLIDRIWKRKTIEKKSKFYFLPKSSTSETYKQKIDKVVNNISNLEVDFHFITASENCAWLLNIRGQDSPYSPIPHSYILIDKNKQLKLFCDKNKISSSVKKYLRNIHIIDINLTERILRNINGKNFSIDSNTCSIFFENCILKNNSIINIRDPIYSFKSIKNKKEIENMKLAHIHDGVALTKYLFWIKKNYIEKKITELSASQKLYKLRQKSNSFRFSSFPTISGSGPNGAIIHYRPTVKTDRKLKKGDIYLVDSGGQYEFGTTDVTRTISLNNSNKRIKNIFTRVLKGHISVASYKLNKNSSGSKIDIEARKHLKKVGLNYSHGTGHGVGYFLNVHEGPHAISHKNQINFKEGMIVSNEPGYYEKNNFGIRIENLIYVKKQKKKLYFDNLTLVPIDKELINQKLLNYNEIKWINKYHQKVFKNLKNKMTSEEKIDLIKACSAL